MLATAITIAYAMIGIALLLTLWRLLRGPGLPDRIMALDTLYINTVALLVLIGIRRGSALYFEAALLIALIGFIGTVALCKYVLRGDIIE
jgi:multicomponent K+:H+ antiporter subunit F